MVGRVARVLHAVKTLDFGLLHFRGGGGFLLFVLLHESPPGLSTHLGGGVHTGAGVGGHQTAGRVRVLVGLSLLQFVATGDNVLVDGEQLARIETIVTTDPLLCQCEHTLRLVGVPVASRSSQGHEQQEHSSLHGFIILYLFAS